MAAGVAEDRKATDVLILDMRAVTLVADYFLICSAGTTIQVKAVADKIVETLKQHGINAGHVEGYDGGTWILLDYGSVIMHVFAEREREFYGLERLWADAVQVEAGG